MTIWTFGTVTVQIVVSTFLSWQPADSMQPQIQKAAQIVWRAASWEGELSQCYGYSLMLGTPGPWNITEVQPVEYTCSTIHAMVYCGTTILSGNRQRHPALKAANTWLWLVKSSATKRQLWKVPCCATNIHAQPPCRQKQMRKSSCLRYGLPLPMEWKKIVSKRIFWMRSLHLYTQTWLRGAQITSNRADFIWPCIASYYMRYIHVQRVPWKMPVRFVQYKSMNKSLQLCISLPCTSCTTKGSHYDAHAINIWAVFMPPVGYWLNDYMGLYGIVTTKFFWGIIMDYRWL